MYKNRRLPENYISKWYLMDTYRLSYAPNINPMPGPNDWPIDRDVDPIEPPIPKTQRGRPKKLRRRGDDETVPDESTPLGTATNVGQQSGDKPPQDSPLQPSGLNPQSTTEPLRHRQRCVST